MSSFKKVNLFTKMLCFVLIFTLVMPVTNVFAFSKSNFKVGQVLHNFKLEEQYEVGHMDSIANLFVHQKTGTELLYMENDEAEKTFSISFRTYPQNSKGSNHIIEHSVINGSKNYPVRSPFVHLIANSMATFVNALTFHDFTVYPVASKNEKDFQNLMKVYLDGVFFPTLLEDEKIFNQEGIRYEFDETGKLKYNGTVYNEMKGQYSTPYTNLSYGIMESLYPDTHYVNNSGGNPEKIQDLTYKELVELYKTNYAPSNSVIFLSGKLDLGDNLKIIDSYLSNFTKTDVNKSPKIQKPFEKSLELTKTYPVSVDSKNNKSYLAYNYALNKTDNYEENLKMNIIVFLLVLNDYAPLKKALNDLKVCENLQFSYDDYAHQSTFSIIFEGVDLSKQDLITKTIDDTLKSISKNGVDAGLLEVVKNSYELVEIINKKNAPNNGINLAIETTKSYMYGKNSIDYFKTSSPLKVSNSLNQDMIKSYVEKYFLENTHKSVLKMVPDVGGIEEFDKDTDKKLDKVLDSMTDADKDLLKKKQKELLEWQSTPDSAEQLAKLPKLSLNDLKSSISFPKYSKEEINGVKYVFTEAETGGISSFDIAFDASAVPQESILYAQLLTELLGMYLSTENYSNSELDTEFKKVCSGLSANLSAVADYNDKDKYSPRYMINIMALDSKVPATMKVLEEMILKTKFDNKEPVLQFLKERKSTLDLNIASFASSYNSSNNFSESDKYVNFTKGYPYYEFITDLNNNFETKWPDISEELEKVFKIIINKDNLYVGFAGNKEAYEKFKNSSSDVFKNLSNTKREPLKYKFENSSKSVAFSSTLLNNNEVILTSKLPLNAKNNLGKYRVIVNLLTYSYLWPVVRDKEGAYGVFLNVREDGLLSFSSYRDPNIKKTIDNFKASTEYLDKLSIDQSTLNNTIIKTVSNMDERLSPYMLWRYGLMEVLGNYSSDKVKEMREQALKITPEDLKEFSSLLKDSFDNSTISVSGKKESIDSEKNLFDKIINVN